MPKIAIQFTDADVSLNRLTTLPEYRTIDIESLVDIIISRFDPKRPDEHEEVIALCVDSVATVSDYDDSPEYFEKMVKDISNLILCIFNKITEYGIDKIIESGYVNTRVVKQWRDLYVIEFKQ